MFTTITRRRYLAGTYIDGEWVTGGYVDSSVIASVQPSNHSSDLLLLPEGMRTRGAVKAYCDVELRTVDEENQIPADRILWDGEYWEVQHVDKHALGIAHYKAICVRLER